MTKMRKNFDRQCHCGHHIRDIAAPFSSVGDDGDVDLWDQMLLASKIRSRVDERYFSRCVGEFSVPIFAISSLRASRMAAVGRDREDEDTNNYRTQSSRFLNETEIGVVKGDPSRSRRWHNHRC